MEKEQTSLVNLYILLISSLLFIGSSRFLEFSMAIWIFKHTHSNLLYGLFVFVSLIPYYLGVLFSGIILDNSSKKKCMLMAILIAFLILAALYAFELLYKVSLSWWYIMIFIFSTFSSIIFSAPTVIIPMITPQNKLLLANGLLNILYGISELIIPVIAAFIFAYSGIKYTLLISCALIVSSFLMVLRLEIPNDYKEISLSFLGKTGFYQLKKAFIYIKNRIGILYLFIYFFMIDFFFSGCDFMMTTYVLKYYTPFVLGILCATIGFGMIAGTALLLFIKPNKIILLSLFIIFTQIIFIWIILTLSNIYLIGLGIFTVALGMPIIFSTFKTLLHLKIDNKYRGRVLSLQILIAGLGQPIGFFLSGILFHYINIIISSQREVINGFDLSFILQEKLPYICYFLLLSITMFGVIGGVIKKKQLWNLEKDLPNVNNFEKAPKNV